MGNNHADFTEIMFHGLSEATYLGLNIAFYTDTPMTVYTFDPGMGGSCP
jgi:hypothetical protein